MPDENTNEKDKFIFIAKLNQNKQFVVETKTTNLMALSYAWKLLGLHIDNMIIKSQMDKAPKIVKLSKGGLDSLRKFLN